MSCIGPSVAGLDNLAISLQLHRERLTLDPEICGDAAIASLDVDGNVVATAVTITSAR